MAMKRAITKEEYAKLPEHFKSEYKADGDGYKLDVDGADDAAAALRARDAEKAGRAKALQEKEEAERKLAEATEALEAANGKVAKGTAAEQELAKVKKTVDDLNAARAADIADMQASTRKTLIGDAAADIAKSVAGKNADVLMPHVQARMTVKFDEAGKNGKLVMLDKDGNEKADLTPEAVKQEMLADKRFSSIVVASKAHGGGTPGAPAKPSGGSAPGAPQTPQAQSGPTPMYATMKPGDLRAIIEAKKAEAAA